MKPKKKSSFDYWLAAFALIAIVFFAAHSGAAYAEVRGQSNAMTLFFNALESRLSAKPLSFAWNEYVKTYIIWGGFAWFVGTAYIFTTKRKYIIGKEYGTAEWGTPSDIRDLFAENIVKQEIRKAKKTRTALGRAMARRVAYRECERGGRAFKALRLKELEDWKSAEKASGRKVSRDELTRRRRKIDEAARESVRQAKLEAWEPDKINSQYEIEAAAVQAEYQKRIKITTEAQRDAALKEAEAARNKALRDFYHSRENVARLKAKYANADAIFTKTERISIYNYKLNNNTLILGGSGSGKTRGYVLPNVLQAHSSYVITDPKGEILEKTGRFLTEVKGYKIRVLNLDNKAKSDGYNPFAYIHPEREGYEERVLALIEAIIINTDGGERKSGSDPFWDKAERLFLQAIFFFACDGFVEAERNMNTVLALIGMLRLSEDKDNYDSDLDYLAKIFEAEHGSDHIGVQQFKEFREKASGKTAKSIVISAVARLAPFRTSAVRRIFSYDTMSLDRLGEELTAIFVVVPPTDSTFNFIAGMLFTQMFQELQYCATEVHRRQGRLPVPVRFILDEFANTCTIPQFVKILAYARSFGIGITPILQSLEQIKNMYKDEWGVIVDNCNTLLFLGSITHMDTLEYMSKLLGKGTFDKRTTGRSRGRQGSSSWNWDVIGRDLMDSSEIRKISKENCLFIVGGRNPFYSVKYNYEAHPNYRCTSDGNKAYSYEYIPTPPPELPAPALAERNESPHREDVEAAKAASEARVSAVMKRIESEPAAIELSNNYQALLTRLGSAFAHLAPVPDDTLSADDGEDDAATDAAILEFLDDTASEEAAAAILEKESAARVAEAMRQIGVAADKIELTGDVVKVAKTVCEIGAYLAPVPDETQGADDGESGAAEAVGAFLEDITPEDGGEQALAAIEATRESLFAELSGMIDGVFGGAS